jgi:hypothetical protein
MEHIASDLEIVLAKLPGHAHCAFLSASQARQRQNVGATLAVAH